MTCGRSGGQVFLKFHPQGLLTFIYAVLCKILETHTENPCHVWSTEAFVDNLSSFDLISCEFNPGNSVSIQCPHIHNTAVRTWCFCNAEVI